MKYSFEQIVKVKNAFFLSHYKSIFFRIFCEDNRTNYEAQKFVPVFIDNNVFENKNMHYTKYHHIQNNLVSIGSHETIDVKSVPSDSRPISYSQNTVDS